MSKIVLNFKSQQYPLEKSPSSFENLRQLIEEIIGDDIPSLYTIYVVDQDGDQITLGSQQDLETNLSCFMTHQNKSSQFMIHVKEADVSKSVYWVASRQNQMQNDDLNSMIIDRSLVEQTKKVQELKKEQLTKDLARKSQQISARPSFEESIFQKPEDQLSIDYIMNYYKTLLIKYETNYNQQPKEQQIKQEETYRKNFSMIVQRLQAKLTNQFEEVMKIALPDNKQNQEKVQEQETINKKEIVEKKEVVEKQEIQPKQNLISNQEQQRIPQHQGQNEPFKATPTMLKSKQIGIVLDVSPGRYLEFVKKHQNESVENLISMIMDEGHK